MKKMLIVDLQQTIRKTRVSYIAVILFVTMSIGTLLGLSWIGPGVAWTANDYYDKQSVADMIAQSANGFTDDDLTEIRKLPDIAAAEGVYQTEVHFNNDEDLLSLLTVSHEVNKIEVLEGELPDAADEIALEKEMAEEFGYGIGDKISLNSSLKQLTGYDIDSLKEKELVVTGIVHHPLYTSLTPGTAKGYSASYRENYYYYAVVDGSAFQDSVTANKYNTILLRSRSLEGLDRFGDEYSADVSNAVDEFKDKIDGAKDWIITDITATMGYYAALMSKDTGGKFGGIMAVFFFAIGLLVCFSTVLRIVEEESRLIGTKEANGFTRGAVISKYLWYVLSAVAIGSILGVGAGFGISHMGQIAATSLMTFSGAYNYFDVLMTLIVICVEFAAMICITLFAVMRQVKNKITNLLTNSKENSAMFNALSKLSFVKHASVSVQSFLYNISMDGTRVLATIVGMVGSLTLLIGPFSLFFSIKNTPQVQYEEIFQFDHTIAYISNDAKEETEQMIDEDQGKYVSIRLEDGVLSREGASSSMIALIVAENPSDFEQLVKLRDTKTGSTMPMNDEGVYIWYAENRDHNVNTGDTISVTSHDGGEYTFKVSGIYENHDSVTNRIFMTKAAYEKATGNDCEPNAFLAAISEDTAEKVSNIDGVLHCSNDEDSCYTFFSTMVTMTLGILGLVVVLSAVIAFLILVNLNVQFVQEKKNDLIVMRINGFSIRDAKFYIARDNILLSVISVVFGAVCGYFLSNVLINAMQMEGQFFITRISIPAYLIGIGVTLFYMIITTLIATRPISKLDLTDINKL